MAGRPAPLGASLLLTMSALPSSEVPSSARPIRVLQVVGNAIVGGMERFVERLIQHLPADKFTVTVLCPFEGIFTERLRNFGVEVLIAPMPDDPPWTVIQMVCALVSSKNIDVLHAHLPNAHVLAGLVGKLCRKRVLTTIHGRQITMLDLEVHRASSTYLSVVCQQSYLHSLGIGVESQYLSCEPNGVDTELFRPGQRPEEGLRNQLKLVADQPLVAFVGRLSPEKGPEVFVRAVLLMHERLPSAHFAIVGEGPMLATIQDFIDRYKLKDFTHLVGGRENMPDIFRDIDLVVSSSHSEAMPLALMEAMSTGIPVVATRVGGVPDMVEHGRSGWLVAPRDFEDIASRVVQTLTTTGMLERMGKHARSSMVTRMDLRDSIARVAALLERLARTAEEPSRIAALISNSAQRRDLVRKTRS